MAGAAHSDESSGSPGAEASSASRDGKSSALDPNTRQRSVLSKRERMAEIPGARSAPTIRYFGSAMLIECASTSPASCELTSATTTPMRVNPSQIGKYSAQFDISSETASPPARPREIPQREY